MLKMAKNIIKNSNISVVSAQDPFEYGWTALRAVQGTPAKLHIQIHTDFLSPWFTRKAIMRSPKVSMPPLNRVRILIAKSVIPKAHGIRVVSQRIKDSLILKFGEGIAPTNIIPIRVSTEMAPPVVLPPHPFTFALLSVSRLEPEKRIEDIIAAISRLHSVYPSLGVLIVGEGSERPRLD
jgi:glycosyltransferase involved in cell wall biosynthesis